MEGQIYTVSEVNGFIKNVIDGIPQLSGIYIRGTYTIDAAAAAELVRRLHPRLVLPMHFRRGEQGFPELTTLEDFLSRLPEQPVHRLTEETLDLKSNGTSGVVIFPRR